jgi:hypothetical protein
MLKRKLIITAIIVIVAFIGIYIYNGVQNASEQQQIKAIEGAVIQSAVQCCSIEGAYPQDLEYLENNYGLIIDEEEYIVVYELIASNILPEVTVLKKQ